METNYSHCLHIWPAYIRRVCSKICCSWNEQKIVSDADTQKERAELIISLRKDALEVQGIARNEKLLKNSKSVFASLDASTEQMLSAGDAIVLKDGVQYVDISALAMNVNQGLIMAGRQSERRMSTEKAEALLRILREELSLPPTEATIGKSIQSARNKLISLTEMMAEAQASLSDVSFRVADIESTVKQLPEILRGQQTHLRSLDKSIEAR